MICEKDGAASEKLWISSPLQIVRQHFTDTCSNHGNVTGQSDDWEERVTAEFAAKEKGEIPPLGADSPSGSLVRYQCMIQDMLDQEFYMKRYLARDAHGNEHLATGKYSDIPDLPPNYEVDFASAKQAGRLVYYCVPIPGRAGWTTATTPTLPAQPRVNTVQVQKAGVKRPLEHDGEDMDTSADQVKKKKEEEGIPLEQDTSTFTGLNLVLPTDTGPCCVALLYDQPDQTNTPFKINDMIEIVGVVERLEPLPHTEEMELDEGVRFPPSSIVPRVHCVGATKLPHINPLTPCTIASSEFSDIRTELLSLLKECVCGDPVAANYLLLHLISSVYARCDEVMALGKFTLNISKCPDSELVGCLSSFLSQITEKCFLLPMTISNLNHLTMIPKKDYKANRLQAGLLQLSDGTQVVVDETVLQPGQLQVNGVETVKSLGNLISWQKLQYDFGFNYNIEFECNTKLLVLSEGKSLLPSDVHVPLSPMQDHPDYGALRDRACASPLLDKFRVYLTVCRDIQYKDVEPDVREVIEQDFVTERKNNPKEVTGETLHRSLVTARLVALSHGHTTLSLQDWQTAKALEKDRLSRLAQANV